MKLVRFFGCVLIAVVGAVPTTTNAQELPPVPMSFAFEAKLTEGTPAEEPPAEAPTSDASAGAPKAAGTAHRANVRPSLAAALLLVDEGEYEAAAEALEKIDGALTLEELVARDEALGISLAFVDRTDASVQAFVRLLSVAPSFRVPYTLSPKATFVFEKARQQMRGKPALRVDPRVEAKIAFAEPVPVELWVSGNEVANVHTFETCWRLADAVSTSFSCEKRVRDVSSSVQATTLPPVARPETATEDGGLVSVFIAVHGYDAAGNEIYRGPTRERPQRIVVGAAQALPWYFSPWLLGGAAAAAATTAVVAGVGAGVAGFFLLRPDTARLGVTVQ